MMMPPTDYPWPLDAVQSNYRAVCYHEAGHLQMLRHFGCVGWIRINPPDYSNPELTPFSGCVRTQGLPTDPGARRLVGLAGIAAEHLQATSEPDTDYLAELVAIQEVRLSDTDAALASGYERRHLEQALRLLWSQWRHVEWVAYWELSKWPGGDA